MLRGGWMPGRTQDLAGHLKLCVAVEEFLSRVSFDFPGQKKPFASIL